MVRGRDATQARRPRVGPRPGAASEPQAASTALPAAGLRERLLGIHVPERMILLINAADMGSLDGGGSIVAIVAFSIRGMAVGHHLGGPKPAERAHRSHERADLARVGPPHRSKFASKPWARRLH